MYVLGIWILRNKIYFKLWSVLMNLICMFFSSLKIRFLPVVAWEVQVIDYMSIQIEYNHWKEKNPDVLVSKNGLIFCLHITLFIAKMQFLKSSLL